MSNKLDEIILYKEKNQCCGCGACMNVCPRNAISLVPDKYGFVYPEIDESLCIKCGQCIRVCSYQSDEPFSSTSAAFAGVNKNEQQLFKSASGGIFSAIAAKILKDKGVVYGCSMEYADGKLTPKHIRVTKPDELVKLQGSKYVQSSIGYIYREVKQDLVNGKTVLFSGTPCQVAALKKYLGKTNADNLYTIDLICHGVPSAEFFGGYIDVLKCKYKSEVVRFIFRDKSSGWGTTAKVYINKSNNCIISKSISVRASSYYMLFESCEIFRENCYSCKYARSDRVGDITIGDYWGIQNEHPEYLKSNGGALEEKTGISCILVNNEHGNRLINEYAGGIVMCPSTIEKVSSQNGQLKKPSEKGKNREKIMDIYLEGGYKAVDDWYNKSLGLKRYLYAAWNCVPVSMKKFINKIRKK